MQEKKDQIESPLYTRRKLLYALEDALLPGIPHVSSSCLCFFKTFKTNFKSIADSKNMIFIRFIQPEKFDKSDLRFVHKSDRRKIPYRQEIKELHEKLEKNWIITLIRAFFVFRTLVMLALGLGLPLIGFLVFQNDILDNRNKWVRIGIMALSVILGVLFL